MSRTLADTGQLAELRPAVISIRAATSPSGSTPSRPTSKRPSSTARSGRSSGRPTPPARYRPAARRIEFSDGLAAVVGLTAEYTRLGASDSTLRRRARYGGWLSADSSAGHTSMRSPRRCLRAPSLIWRTARPIGRPRRSRSPRRIQEVTHLVDLSDGAEVAGGRWRSKARGSANRARRAGVTVREAARVDDWLAYDALYREALARWNSTTAIVYDRSLFAILAELDSASVRLWLAELDGVVCAGALAFTHRRRAVGWHSVTAPARAPGSANLLQWEMIAAFADEGITTYDLNPSGGRAGVARFKESLGGVPRRLKSWREGVPWSARSMLLAAPGRCA